MAGRRPQGFRPQAEALEEKRRLRFGLVSGWVAPSCSATYSSQSHLTSRAPLILGRGTPFPGLPPPRASELEAPSREDWSSWW